MPSLAPPVPSPAPHAGGSEHTVERLGFWQQAWRLGLAWLVGIAAFLTIAAVATEGFTREDEGTTLVLVLLILDLAVGHLALVVAAYRRRWPLAVALITAVMTFVSITASGASALALVSLATRRRIWQIVGVVLLKMAADTTYEFGFTRWLGVQGEVLVEGDTVAVGTQAALANLGFLVLLYVICILVGWNVGSRRELIQSWRTGAETANREQAARVAQAQLAERSRIAREMHDVLAHRLSLVAMHAGVLAHRTDLPEDERREAAEIVRAGAHQALEELREVLGVLRSDVGEETTPDGAPAVEAPQPGVSGIPSLVAEVTSSGQEVHLQADPDLWARSVQLPASTGRHAYRVVQEALTNARKHAGGAAVTVELSGRPGKGLSIVVANPVPAGAQATLPGGGRGLTGMAERVQLAGGRFEAGFEVTRFVVRVWLPWERKKE